MIKQEGTDPTKPQYYDMNGYDTVKQWYSKTIQWNNNTTKQWQQNSTIATVAKL